MSKSITIDNLDGSLIARLRAEAARRGTDVSVVARDALDHGLPPTGAAPVVRPDAIDLLAGTWTAEQAEEFRANTAAFEQIDEDMWR